MINQAIQEAKKRDGWKCRVCGAVPVDGAHLLPRNIPVKEYRPDDPDWITTLCRLHHMEYDKNKTMTDRAGWLYRNALYRERGLIAPLIEGWSK